MESRLCRYGCGMEAKYITPKGGLCCSETRAKCPGIADKAAAGRIGGAKTALSWAIPLEEILKRGTRYQTSRLRIRCYKAGLLKEICYVCGIGPTWNNQPLTLQLDHINGIRTDNRLENLRIICPNCHTQTTTYCAKNRKSVRLRRAEEIVEFKKLSDRKDSCIVSILPAPKKPEKKPCPDCGTEILAESTRCGHCAQLARKQPTKTTWPELSALVEEIKNTSYVAVAKRLGVTDNTVRKHLTARGIDYKTVRNNAGTGRQVMPSITLEVNGKVVTL